MKSVFEDKLNELAEKMTEKYKIKREGKIYNNSNQYSNSIKYQIIPNNTTNSNNSNSNTSM